MAVGRATASVINKECLPLWNMAGYISLVMLST